MRYYFITFRSVTYAQRGERILKQGNFRCGLQRTPRWMEERGCGYSLKVYTGDIAEAVKMLRENQLPMRKVYMQNADGSLEEMLV